MQIAERPTWRDERVRGQATNNALWISDGEDRTNAIAKRR